MKKDNIILTISLFSPLLFLGSIVTYFFLFPKTYSPYEYYKTIHYKGNVQKIYTKYESRGNKLMVRVRYSDYYLPYENANKLIEIGDSVVKRKGETNLYIFRDKILIKTLTIE
ncbi:hypothetical protein [Empedobacter brevis]|uniref:hypothetical protein n=1 Tax=Empedobacter brevis TaxID=247 RepID=UPI0039AFCEAA